jgi:hypothetical protein
MMVVVVVMLRIPSIQWKDSTPCPEGPIAMVALMPLRQKKKEEGKEDREAALIEPTKKTQKEDREDGHDMEMKMGWFSSLLCRADVYDVISST